MFAAGTAGTARHSDLAVFDAGGVALCRNSAGAVLCERRLWLLWASCCSDASLRATPLLRLRASSVFCPFTSLPFLTVH